jgi:hypothetical protein
LYLQTIHKIAANSECFLDITAWNSEPTRDHGKKDSHRVLVRKRSTKFNSGLDVNSFPHRQLSDLLQSRKLLL